MHYNQSSTTINQKLFTLKQKQMKKLIALVSGVLLSSMSFSQTVTKTASDSVVVMNKKLVQYMIQDLIRYDADKQALDILNISLSKKDDYISAQQELINKQVESLKKANDLISDFSNHETEMQISMEKLKNDLHKSKVKQSVLAVGLLGAVSGIILNHYMWKYGGKQ